MPTGLSRYDFERDVHVRFSGHFLSFPYLKPFVLLLSGRVQVVTSMFDYTARAVLYGCD